MPWKISSRMLEDIAAENSETYRRIFEATFYRPRYVVDDTLFAKTELPEDGGLPYPRDYAYEELQVWRQRTGRLKSTLTYEGDPKTWGRPQK
jgi:hypothetical protein